MAQKQFIDLGLEPQIQSILKHSFQWDGPTQVQATVIPIALQRRDLLVQAVTGSGKTGAFVLPIIDFIIKQQKQRPAGTCALILSPTRELAQQTAAVIDLIGRRLGISGFLLVGGQEDFKDQQQLLTLQPNIIIATPGRLIDHLINSPVTIQELQFLILDEADKLLQMGFQRDIEQILKHVPRTRQTLLFSATMSTAIQKLGTLALQKPLSIKIDNIRINNNITQQFILLDKYIEQDAIKEYTPSNYFFAIRTAMLLHIFKQFQNKKIIMFMENRLLTQKLQLSLQFLFQQLPIILQGTDEQIDQYYTEIFILHGQMSQNERFETVYSFNNVDSGVLIATDLGSRGLDIKRCDAVILFNVPPDFDTYVHRIGRTGRAGNEGVAITMGTTNQITKLINENPKQKDQLQERVIGKSVGKIIKQLQAFLLSKEFLAEIERQQNEMIISKTINEIDEQLKQFDSEKESGQFVLPEEKRKWYLTDKDRKAFQKVVHDTRNQQFGKHAAKTTATQSSVDGFLHKLERGAKQKQKHAQKHHETIASVRQVKYQIKQHRKSGELLSRNLHFKAKMKGKK